MQEIGLDSHQVLGNQLVSLLVDSGNIHNAHEVFNKLPYQSECLWASLMNGYVKHGKPQQALSLYSKILEVSIQPSKYTFVSLLKACLKLKDVECGHRLHVDISKRGLESDLFVGSALVDMFAKFDLMQKAQEVFDKLANKDAMPWNAMISAYSRQGHCREALDYYERMQSEGVTANVVTFVCVLKACSGMAASDDGREIHVEVSRRGFDKGLVVGNTLIDMYGKCGLPMKAQDVFDKLPVRDVISWTALISGYVRHGCGIAALNCFKQMKLQGFSPDVVTLVCSLKACGMTKSVKVGEDIHAEIARDGLLEKNPLVGNALVDMYAKCGLLEKAQEVFAKLRVRDATSWNALIAGYCKQGFGHETLASFEQMRSAGVSPDAVTLSCILKALGNLGAIDYVSEVHAAVSKGGLLKTDLVVGNGLVDMYAKCGLLLNAQDTFDNLLRRDVVSWNSLLAGYAQLGESATVFCVFYRMLTEKERPNEATFGSILNACTHSGLVMKGQTYFRAMLQNFGITPTVELHTCVIDLLGRAGQLERAVMMAERMPVHPTLVVWNTVLGACRKWGNIELAKPAFYHALALESRDAAAYVCMYNIYADTNMSEEARSIEVLGLMNQAWDSSERIRSIESG
ncbi:hypothetical protein GOP47_0003557 [Adiantum capillus-veneris]|uniref:Pentatricopeptide repeat-containing protein n=1 Tax=Adiantum capillus-veneris TaxID=13818 RepID=A0A9D4ZQ53_ADICA|nr:hypothetical protein GOP47_0003557 [Adiantum capillus-veneris]